MSYHGNLLREGDHRLYDQWAEAGLLSTCILSGARTTLKVAEMVTVESFHSLQNQIIFTACLNLALGGSEVDIITLKAGLEAGGLMDDAGGLSYIMQLADYEYTAANMPYYARILQEKQLLRGTYSLAHDIGFAAAKSEKTASEVLAELETGVIALGELHNGRGAGIYSSFDAVAALTERLLTPTTEVFPITSGVPPLDALLAPLQAGETTILAARPSVGKTTLLQQYVYNACKRGVRSLIFSLEMTAEQLTQRLACRISGVDNHQIRANGFESLTETQRKSFTDALRTISRLPLTIVDQSAEVLTATRMLSITRQKHLDGGLDFVGIDYLQKTAPETGKKFASREQEVAHVSRTVSLIALQNKVPVLVLAQLNRDGSQNPTMDDLRESGAIEADAYNIVLLSPMSKEDDNPTFSRVRARVEKQRDGRTGTVEMAYEKQKGAFRALTTASA